MFGTWLFALAVGCHNTPVMDYRPLDQAGMNSGTIERLKTLNISDSELQQFVRLKSAGVSDDTCVTLISTAHDHKRSFSSADSVANLLNARYTESDVITYTQADKLDSISGDAVMLRLIGLSDPNRDRDPATRSARFADHQFRRDRPPEKHRPERRYESSTLFPRASPNSKPKPRRIPAKPRATTPNTDFVRARTAASRSWISSA